MTPFPNLAAVLLLLTPPGTPAGGFRWQRIITPPPGAGLQQACVVLDAATFANAAPALGDLRLFQDGTELPYVIEESYDERSLSSGVTLPEDRSEFEPVLTVPLRKGEPSAQAGAPSAVYGSAELPARVPIERVRFVPVPDGMADVSVVVTAQHDGTPPPQEVVNGDIDAQKPVFPVTIGANLQHAAKLFVAIDHSRQVFTQAIFEMRRRSLCYQPRTPGPLVLYLGGGQGMAAKTYGLASGFSTTAERPYGILGPLEPNPDQTPRLPEEQRLLRYGVVAAAAVLVCALVATWLRMIRAVRRKT